MTIEEAWAKAEMRFAWELRLIEGSEVEIRLVRNEQAAVRAAMMAAADIRGADKECVACGCKDPEPHMEDCEVQAMLTRLYALAGKEKE